MGNDDLGAKLLLSVPATIIHELDVWSPLCPEDSGGLAQSFPGLVRRAADAEAVSEDCAAAAHLATTTASGLGSIVLPSTMTWGAQVRSMAFPSILYNSAFGSRLGASTVLGQSANPSYASVASQGLSGVARQFTPCATAVTRLRCASGDETVSIPPPRERRLRSARDRVEAFLRQAWVEVVVVVEGCEP